MYSRRLKRAPNENKAKIEEYFRLRGKFPPVGVEVSDYNSYENVHRI
jgi:hypothetical protein